MPKKFYTDRDIDDMIRDGITSLEVNDDIVVTDIARERAYKSGFKFIREDDIAPSTPIRPYVVKNPIKKQEKELVYKEQDLNLEKKVLAAVQAKVGDSIDKVLLETIIKRIIKSIGGS